MDKEKDKEKDNIDLKEIQLKNQIFEEILNRKILLKLKKNLSYFVDGRIIKFSELIRLHSCNNKFDNKLTYEDVDRHTLIIIVEFLEIIQWKHHQYTFDAKLPELDCWWNHNKLYLNEVENLAKRLKIYIIQDFFKYYELKKERIVRENGFFKTLIDVTHNGNKSTKICSLDEDDPNKHASKDFENAEVPDYPQGKELSYKIPIKIYQVKLNASKNNSKSKFNVILKDKELDALVDAMISDSFWFIVVAFKYNKKSLEKKGKEETLKQIVEMMKRLSQNYFNFFIKLCEFKKPSINDNQSNLSHQNLVNVHNTNNQNSNSQLMTVNEDKHNEGSNLTNTNNGVIVNTNNVNQKEDSNNSINGNNLKVKSSIPNHYNKNIKTVFNKDTILDSFYDYMAQCIFYGLYLAFPKSRQKFNNEFRQLLVSFFGYLFNGLNVHNKYNTEHWDLDLGSGNIIEPDEPKKSKKINKILL